MAASATMTGVPKRRMRPPKAIDTSVNQIQPMATPARTSVNQWTPSMTREPATATESAAVPSKLFTAIKILATGQNQVSPIILSLAHGVTHMALTRTKMFIACAMVAGVLTTGIGTRIMSSADAQNPKADPSPEQIKNAIEFLQKARHQQPAQPPSDRFEYKFVPIEKPLSAEELRRLVSAFDREGWEYTGAQDLATGNKTGSTIPHVVFKKLRQADDRTAEA